MRGATDLILALLLMIVEAFGRTYVIRMQSANGMGGNVGYRFFITSCMWRGVKVGRCGVVVDRYSRCWWDCAVRVTLTGNRVVKFPFFYIF
jgi:hypothetical protein